MEINLTSQTDSSNVYEGELFNFVHPAEEYTYDINLRNLSLEAANNVIVTMQLPIQVQYQQSTYDPMISNGANLIWSFGNLDSGFDYSWTVTVKVDRNTDSLTTELSCLVTVDVLNDSVLINNSATEIVKYKHQLLGPEDYDLAVNLSYVSENDTVITRNGQNYNALFIGDPFQYKIEIQNNSDVDAENVSLQQTLPAGLTYVSSLPSGNYASNSIAWDIPVVAANSALIYTVDLQSTFTAEQHVSSAVIINSSNDNLPFNNSSIEELYFIPKPIQIVQYDLALTLSVLSDTTITLDGSQVKAFKENVGFKYHINIVNNGPSTAENISVTLPISASLEILKTDHAPIQNVNNVLTWNIGSLAATHEWGEVVELKPKSSLPYEPYEFSATASLNAEKDTNAGNNQQTAVCYGLQKKLANFVDLQVTSFIQADSISQGLYYTNGGSTVSYRVEVENVGDLTANNIRLVTYFDSRFSSNNYMPAPVEIKSDSVVWLLNTIPASGKNSFLVELETPTTLAIGLHQLLVGAKVSCANEENALRANNTIQNTIYSRVNQSEDFTPLINVSTQTADVSDSISVSVNFPVQISEWTLTIALPSGDLIQDYAQNFIATTPIQPNTWIEIKPKYIHNTLVSGNPEDRVTFQLAANGSGGSTGYAETVVTFNSTNDLIFDRNVFKTRQENSLAVNFKMIADGHALCQVYDTVGHHVTTLADNDFAGGWTTIQWDGNDEDGRPIGSGVYLVTLQTDHANLYKKVIIVR